MLGDFWSWAYSDPANSASRGVLAEFLISRALGTASTAIVTGKALDLNRRNQQLTLDDEGSVRDFANGTEGAGDTEFRRWLTENPDGYFVNVTGPARGMLHRGRCPHMKFGPDDPASLVTNLKWTSEDRRELEARAQQEGYALERCRDCDV